MTLYFYKFRNKGNTSQEMIKENILQVADITVFVYFFTKIKFLLILIKFTDKSNI